MHFTSRPAPHLRHPATLPARVAPALLAIAGLVAVPAAAQDAAPQHVAEVEAVAASEAVREAFALIESLDEWTLERHIEITETAAPPFMEEERGALYAGLLREYGADSVWTDEVGNVFGLRRGTGGGERTVAVGGHLDTVFPPETDVSVRMVGDTLFAPGVGDDSRGLAIVLTLLRVMVDEDIRTRDDVVFIGTVGEEGLGDLRGMKHIYREGADAPDVWIEIDGGGENSIVSMGLGSKRYRVTFEGEGGHSWGAFGLANPAHALGRAIRHFQDVADTLTRSGPRTSYNVGRIGGGTSVNSVPFEAWMEVDMRSVDPASLDRIEQVFLAAMDRALTEENALAREGEPLTVNKDKIGDRPSGEMDPEHPLVQRAMAVTDYMGQPPYLSRSSTNSNTPISLDVPAVTIGRGGIGANGHALDEYWVNRDGWKAIQRALLLTLVESGLPGIT
jgi:acetylornithine deacetylase/succinyl-diaminopimelate desuccinylase-like protein